MPGTPNVCGDDTCSVCNGDTAMTEAQAFAWGSPVTRPIMEAEEDEYPEDPPDEYPEEDDDLPPDDDPDDEDSSEDDNIEEAVVHIPSDCSCESCKMRRFEGSKLRGAIVHGYSFKPHAWRLMSARDDPFAYHMGVELETDSTPASHGQNGLAADMRRPKGFWVAKSDGSVSGPEFASHPATLTWWHDHSSHLEEMFKMLVHAGYRSHDGGHAGMHVNISRTAFGSASHLYRFMYLIHYSARWSLLMSQRSSGQASQWAALDRWRTAQDIEYAAGVAYDEDRNDYSQKYTSVHTPYREKRVEFRLPRGTLRLDRFMKNLEWTAGMVEFTRGSSRLATPEQFMEWARAPAAIGTYDNLVMFLDEKSVALSEAAHERSLA